MTVAVKRSPSAIVLGVAMVALIVAVDVLWLRDDPWVRLAVNVGIVAVFAAIYFRFIADR